jgi:hypothetical protein
MHGLRLRLVTAGNYSHGLFLSAHEYIRSYGTLTILVPTPSVNRVDLIWRLGYCQYPSVPAVSRMHVAHPCKGVRNPEIYFEFSRTNVTECPSVDGIACATPDLVGDAPSPRLPRLNVTRGPLILAP